jgi:predicted small secreted protein
MGRKLHHQAASRRIRTAKLVGLVAALAFAMSACNTMRGVGEDVESAGRGIEEAAD